MSSTMRKNLLLTLLLALIAGKIFSQSDAQISQYWLMQGYFNPSALSLNNKLNVAALNRMQWTAVTNPPNNFTVTAETPL